MAATGVGEYDRGVVAGEINARLSDHDLHFAAINGSMGRLADEMHLLVNQVQRLGDAADADRKTVVVTAEALKEADNARRDKGTARWTPWQRLCALLGAAGATAAIVYEFVHR